jgi:hypothetical protein
VNDLDFVKFAVPSIVLVSYPPYQVCEAATSLCPLSVDDMETCRLLGAAGACKVVIRVLRKHGETHVEAAYAVRLFFCLCRPPLSLSFFFSSFFFFPFVGPFLLHYYRSTVVLCTTTDQPQSN